MEEKSLIKEHNAKEKVVMNFFTEAVLDFQTSFLAKGCERFISPRVQTIISFTFAEILSSFWDCYTDSRKTPDARMIEWFNNFCSTDKNITYKNNHYFEKLGIEPLLQLRHSLVHFYGMSRQQTGKEIALISSDANDEFSEKLKNSLKNKNVAVLKPIDFYNLFKDGGLLMMKAMINNIESSHVDKEKEKYHIEGINRIFEKFKAEGAMQFFAPIAKPSDS